MVQYSKILQEMSNFAQEEFVLEQEYETIDLREVFSILKSNILVIIASAAICGLIGMLVTTFLITPKYQADGMLIVNNRSDASTVVTYDNINSAKNLVGTYSVVLKSETVLKQVIDALGISDAYSPSGLASAISINAVDQSQVMKLSITDEDPERARSIIAELMRIAAPVLTETVEAGSVKIVSEANVTENPVSPNKLMNTVIAVILGGVLAVGYAFLKEMLNNTFVTDSDITKHLGLTVLGVIPRINIEE